MRALVTGGHGFIGSNLVDSLIDEGHSAIVMDNHSTDVHDNFHINEEAENYIWDVNNYDDVLTASRGVDYIFHLAAEARIQPAIENPRLAMQTNVLGTCNVLQAARDNNVKRVMYSSTSSAYGLKSSIPNREDMPTDCLNPYSVSKVAGEELCRMYTDLFGVETITFRYFNVYGERQPTKGQYAPVIGLFQRQKQNGEPMTIVGDGLQRRDYTHVSDVVAANLAAMKTDNEDASGQVFNIGTGTNYNVLDIAMMIDGKEPNIKFIPPRLGEARESLADYSKAKALLDWAPKVKLEDWIG
jgi:UDP-glucose 4-epimerase